MEDLYKNTNVNELKYKDFDFSKIPCRCLKDNIIEITVKEYLKLPGYLKKALRSYRRGIDFGKRPVSNDPYIIGTQLVNSIPNEYKINDREMFMKGIDYSYYYEE